MSDFFEKILGVSPEELMGAKKPRGKKKKVDMAALQSSFMKVPNMRIEAARALMDIGLRELYELQGRSPEVLFEQAREKNKELPEDFVRYFRLAVYCAETPPNERDNKKVHPHDWA